MNDLERIIALLTVIEVRLERIERNTNPQPGSPQQEIVKTWVPGTAVKVVRPVRWR